MERCLCSWIRGMNINILAILIRLRFIRLVRFIPKYFIVFDAIVAKILSFFFRHSIDS